RAVHPHRERQGPLTLRLSPSDAVPPAPVPGGEVEVAGRVLAVSGPSMTLGDAFAVVHATLTAPVPALAPGDLAILAGTLASGAQMPNARVIEYIRPARPSPAHETDTLWLRGVGRGLRARARALRAVRDFFEVRAFLEVETPCVVPSPGLDLHLDAFEVPGGGYLMTSPEYQMKRLLAGGVPRCFQVCHAFREGEVGHRPTPDFTILEWSRAFASIDAVIADPEALVRHVAAALGPPDALDVGGVRVALDGPFERLAVADAFARFAGVPPDDALA